MKNQAITFEDLTETEKRHYQLNLKCLLDPIFGYTEEEAKEEALKKAISNRKTLKQVRNFEYGH